eukprot:9185574-Karenia_brevis.AAC.1
MPAGTARLSGCRLEQSGGCFPRSNAQWESKMESHELRYQCEWTCVWWVVFAIARPACHALKAPKCLSIRSHWE